MTALDDLLPKMLPVIDIRRAISRGTYLIEIAKIEDRGIPIDAERLEAIAQRREDLIRHLISQRQHIDVYDGSTFSQKKFEAFLLANGLAARWKRTETGMYSSDAWYMEEMGRYCPIIEELQQLRKTIL